jgi:hypothetical protein
MLINCLCLPVALPLFIGTLTAFDESHAAEPTNNVTLTLSITNSQSIWRAGSPLRIEVRMHNAETTPIGVFEGISETDMRPVFGEKAANPYYGSLPYLDFEVSLIGPDGRPVPYTKAGRELASLPQSGRNLQIEPGQTRIYLLRLDRYYDFSREGAYKIKVRRSCKINGEWNFSNESNTLTFYVRHDKGDAAE